MIIHLLTLQYNNKPNGSASLKKNVTNEKGELATSIKGKKNSKNEIHLLGKCWGRKLWDIDCGYDIIIQK